MPKSPTSFRLSETALSLLAGIAEGSGVSQASALEIVIREAAKKRSINTKPGKSPTDES